MRTPRKILTFVITFSLFLSTNSSICQAAGLLAAPKPLTSAEEAFVLPDAKIATKYEYQFQSEGGLAPLTWRLVQGDLPPGINLEASGKLHGIPSKAQREGYIFQVEVSDSSQVPQRVTQPFLLMVQAAPLRIVTAAPKLRIITGAADSTGSSSSIVPRTTPTPAFTATPMPRLLSSQSGFQASANSGVALASNQPPTGSNQDNNQPSSPPANGNVQAGNNLAETNKTNEKGTDKKVADPYKFIRIWEDQENGKRHLLYDPTKPKNENTSKVSVDLKSKLIIEPVTKLMDDDMPLNNLYMTARLASGDTSTDLEIEGYSKIGESKETGATQRGASFQSIEDIQTKLFTLAFAADSILDSFYERDPNLSEECSGNEGRALTQQADKEKSVNDLIAGAAAKKGFAGLTDKEKSVLDKFGSKLLVYEPEINSISDFFLEEKNLTLTRIIGARILRVDSDTLQQTAEQYKGQAQIAFNGQSTDEARYQALFILFERTRMIHKIFESIKRETLNTIELKDVNLKKYCALRTDQRSALRREAYADFGKNMRELALLVLKKLIAEGSISLTTAKAKDGDLLTLSVEARGTNGENLGVPAAFEIEIKQFGPKLVVSDSFLFIKRLGLKDSDILESPLGRGFQKVNYAPSPGVTFGVNYFKRGETNFDKFLRALAPGAGVNVSFMNYNDPGFDLVENKFTNTNGVNVQVGVGVIGLLFNNNIQLSYGYNLNADFKRRYFGVGFSFLSIADRLGKYITK